MIQLLKKGAARTLSLFLCLCILATVFAVPASAAGSADTGKESYFLSDLLKSTRTVCLNKLVSWTMDSFMSAMFPPEDTEEVKRLKEIQEQLDVVLANQQKILDELKVLKDVVEVQSYLNILNEYMEALTLCEPFFQCYDTLNSIDKTYAGQPEALKIQRLRALTEGLGISNMTSANTSVDDKFLTLCSRFAGPIAYSVNGEVVSDGDLLDVYREIKRYQYCWENEAWDDMETFFDYAASSFALVSLVEAASVQARIERCRMHNEGLQVTDPDYYSTASLETWLFNDGGTAAESDLESHIRRGGEVYAEHAVVRQNEYRHFWKPGYEVLIYSGIRRFVTQPVNEPLAGKGGTTAGTNFINTEGMRISREGEKAQPVESFWNRFYESSLYPDAQLLTTETVNRMLAACGHTLSLEEILQAGDFSCTNFTGLQDCIGFVLDRDDPLNPRKTEESHDSTWVEGLGTVYTDRIRVYPRYVTKAQTANLEKEKAAKYKTYYYYHTSDGATRWYVQDEYTEGNLAQIYVYEDSCMHNRLQWVESSAIEPTCSHAGKARDWKCLDCGRVFAGETLAPLPHTGTWQHTATEHWRICDVCGEKVDVGPHTSSSPLVFITGLYICDDCGYISNLFAPPASPSTGDGAPLFAGLALLSLGGAVVCARIIRKKKRGEE